MPFNMFPYSNLHNLNLDWILNTVKTMAAAVEAAATTVETYAARLSQVETNIQAITPAANGAVRHDVSQSLDTANRRRAAVNIHAVSYDTVLLSPDERAQARSNIGAAASEAIPDVSDVVRTSAQSFTDAQKTQARTNIGAAAAGAIPDVSDVVRVTAQTFTSAEQRTACGNIKAVSYNTQSASPADRTVARANLQAVGYEAQTLTEAEKTQARTNIGALGSSDIPAPEGAVLYNESQSLTDVQKARARNNIGAISESALPDDYTLTVSENEQGTGYDVTGSLSEASRAGGRVFIVLAQSGKTREALADLVYAGGTLVSASASFVDFFAVDSVIPNTITNVVINSNGATVTDILQGHVPQPSVIGADAGKCLVAGRGTCSWEDKGPLVVTFSGTSANRNASCDKTWAEINAAGSKIELWYQQQYSKTKLVPVIYQNLVQGSFTYISDPADIPGGYTSITCEINSNGEVACTIVDG